MQIFNRFWAEEEGAEVGEWALFFALLAIVAIAAVTALNPMLSSAFGELGSAVLDQAQQIDPIS